MLCVFAWRSTFIAIMGKHSLPRLISDTSVVEALSGWNTHPTVVRCAKPSPTVANTTASVDIWNLKHLVKDDAIKVNN